MKIRPKSNSLSGKLFISRAVLMIVAALMIVVIIRIYFSMLDLKIQQESRQDYKPSRESRELTASIPDEYPSHYWVKGSWFEMPLGFRNPWIGYLQGFPTREGYENGLKRNPRRGYDTETGGYNPSLDTKPWPSPISENFDFCMPSMRYLPRNYYLHGEGRTPGLGPCEAQNNPNSSKDYPVNFRIYWAFVDGVEKSRSLSRFRRNEKSLKENGHYSFQMSPHLEHNKNGPITGNKNYRVYSDDGDVAVSFHCYKQEKVCDGFVWEKSNKILFSIRLPFDKVQFQDENLWEEPVYKVIELIKDWKE